MSMQGNEQIVERERAPKLIELGKSRKIEFAHRHAVCRHGTNCTTKYGRTQGHAFSSRNIGNQQTFCTA